MEIPKQTIVLRQVLGGALSCDPAALMPAGAWRTKLEDEGSARKTSWRSRLWNRALRITRNLPGKGGRGRSVCESLEVCSRVWLAVLCSRSSDIEKGGVGDEVELVGGGSSCTASCESQGTCYTDIFPHLSSRISC